MAKIFKFPDKKRELGQAAAQQQWLKDNDIAQQVAWDWPKNGWFRRRLALIHSRELQPKGRD